MVGRGNHRPPPWCLWVVCYFSFINTRTQTVVIGHDNPHLSFLLRAFIPLRWLYFCCCVQRSHPQRYHGEHDIKEEAVSTSSSIHKYVQLFVCNEIIHYSICFPILHSDLHFLHECGCNKEVNYSLYKTCVQ